MTFRAPSSGFRPPRTHNRPPAARFLIRSPCGHPTKHVVSRAIGQQSTRRRSHTWKKNRTMKTWRPPMHMIRPIWMRLKLIILCSVLRTVLKFRFSRVRKYFWFLVMVDNWPEIRYTDSSSTDVCSGELPCLDGRLTRASFSTCIAALSVSLAPRLAKRSCANDLRQLRSPRICPCTCSSRC